MATHVLFYSNFCTHCQEIITIIKDHHLENMISLVCVDAKRNNLPREVTSVPTIYTPERHFIADIACFDYIAQLVKVQAPTDIMAYNAGIGLASNFESLDSSDSGGGGYFMMSVGQQGGVPREAFASQPPSSKKSTVTDTQLEKFIESRTNDVYCKAPPVRR